MFDNGNTLEDFTNGVSDVRRTFERLEKLDPTSAEFEDLIAQRVEFVRENHEPTDWIRIF